MKPMSKLSPCLDAQANLNGNFPMKFESEK